MNGKALIALLIAGAASAFGAQAQTGWPSKPVRLLSLYPPGAIVDTLTRQIGQEMTRAWGQPLVIDNRPGANGILATEACSKAAADGYTLCLFDRTIPLLPYLYRTLPFDVDKHFVPVTNLVYTVLALVVHPSVGASSLKELLAAAKARPGVLNYASLGPANTANLLMEWLKKANDVSITYVAYKGPPALMQAVLSGESHITYWGLGNFAALHKSGKVKIIAVSGAQRSPIMPDIPTLAEQGLTQIDTRVWFGLFAPAGFPRDAMERTYREVARIFAIAEFREKNLEAAAFEPIGNSPDDFAKFLKADRVAGAELIRISGAHLD